MNYSGETHGAVQLFFAFVTNKDTLNLARNVYQTWDLTQALNNKE